MMIFSIFLLDPNLALNNSLILASVPTLATKYPSLSTSPSAIGTLTILSFFFTPISSTKTESSGRNPFPLNIMGVSFNVAIPNRMVSGSTIICGPLILGLNSFGSVAQPQRNRVTITKINPPLNHAPFEDLFPFAIIV